MQDVHAPSKRMLGRLFGLILAKVLSPLSMFLLIILIARLRGKTDLGRYNTILAWYAIFQFISIFGVTEYISREVGKDASAASKYLSHGLCFGLLSSVMCIFLMAGSAIGLNYPGQLKYGIILIGLALPFGAWTLICQSIFTAVQKIGYIALTSLVESSLVLLLGSVCIFRQYDVVILICSLVIGKALGSAFTLCVMHLRITRLCLEFDTAFFLKCLRPVLAFGLTGVAFQLFMRIGVIILSKMTDMDTVGLYSSASKLTEICLMLPLGFYILMLPVIARGYKSSPATAPQRLQTYTRELFVIVFFTFGFCTIFAAEILRVIYGEAFTAAVWPLRILLAAYLIQCADMVLGMTCQAAGYHKFTMITAMVRAGVHIGLSFVFILIWPLLGVAVATLISISVSFVLFQVFVMKRLHSFNWANIMLKPGLVCLIMAIGIFCFLHSMSLLIQVISYCLGYGVLLLAVNRISPVRVRCDASLDGDERKVF